MNQRASVGINSLKELQQLTSCIAADPRRQLADWIVLTEDLFRSWQATQLDKHLPQIFTIGLGRMGTEVRLMLVPCSPQPLTWSGNLRRIDEPVVLQEPCKHTTEH